MPQKIYLGDSVYAQTEGYYITLTTENGYGPSNTIHLEPQVLRALMVYTSTLSQSPNTQEQKSEVSQDG